MKQKNNGSTVLLFCLVVLLSSSGLSASSASKEKASGSVTASGTESNEIAKSAGEAFMNAPGLSVEQKKKLMDIYLVTYAQAISIKEELKQSKAELFQLIVKKDVKSKEVQAIKDKVYALDQKRLLVMFKAMEDVQKVVGLGEDKKEIYEHLRDYEIPKNRRYSKK